MSSKNIAGKLQKEMLSCICKWTFKSYNKSVFYLIIIYPLSQRNVFYKIQTDCVTYKSEYTTFYSHSP